MSSLLQRFLLLAEQRIGKKRKGRCCLLPSLQKENGYNSICGVFYTMSKLILVILASLAFSCSSNAEINPQAKPKKQENSSRIARYHLDGHYYIVPLGGYKGGILHDPDCPCNRELGDE
jgi:hypothetical protein